MTKKAFMRAYMLALFSLAFIITSSTFVGVLVWTVNLMIWLGTAIWEHVKWKKMKSKRIVRYSISEMVSEETIEEMKKIINEKDELEVVDIKVDDRGHKWMMISYPEAFVDSEDIFLNLGGLIGSVEVGHQASIEVNKFKKEIEDFIKGEGHPTSPKDT